MDPKTNQNLLDRLRSSLPQHEMRVQWGASRLRRRFYQTVELPPIELTTSSRAIVFKGDKVLVIRGTAGDAHIWPGGRREEGEDLDQTMRREVLEEAGWRLIDVKPFGLLHFEHLTPRPDDYAYPYPDFLQAVFTATADTFHRGTIVRDGWEAGSNLVECRSALTTIDEDQRVILQLAMAAHRSPTA